MINKHGVECVRSHTGTHFCHIYARRQKDDKRVHIRYGHPNFDKLYVKGSTEWVTCDEVLVPTICLKCDHYDQGEYGDFGELLAGPFCGVNLHFPTRKGTCARRKE